MAGKATVTVELLDGTSITRVHAWTGGNPRFDAWEFASSAEVAAVEVRSAIAAILGDAKEGQK